MSSTKEREVKESMLKQVGGVFLHSTIVAIILLSGSVVTGAIESDLPKVEEKPEIVYIQTQEDRQEMQKEAEKQQENLESTQDSMEDEPKASDPLQDPLQLEENTSQIAKGMEEVIQAPNSRLKDLVPFLTGTYEENLELLAHIIHAESEGSSDLEQQLVGTIVVYRAFTSAYGVRTEYDDIGSLEAVIYAPNQYSESLENGRFFEEPAEECYRNAAAVLSGETLDDTPRNVLYQATFLQGDRVYMDLNNIFCYENDIAY